MAKMAADANMVGSSGPGPNRHIPPTSMHGDLPYTLAFSCASAHTAHADGRHAARIGGLGAVARLRRDGKLHDDAAVCLS